MLEGKLLVANRGEIAIRICRAAAECGLESVAVFPADDAQSLHVRQADAAVQLPGRGVAAPMWSGWSSWRGMWRCRSSAGGDRRSGRDDCLY